MKSIQPENMNSRFDFFGTKINVTNLDATVEFLSQYDYTHKGYISFPDTSVVARAQKSKELNDILNDSLLTLPDGKPSALYARWKGFPQVSTVSGYWLCQKLLSSSLTHYFLGGTEEKLSKIKAAIAENFPEAKVLGYRAPSFYETAYFEQGNLLEKELSEINCLKPDLIWVGMSSPKQDFMMKYHTPQLYHGVMLGVGGVFDYLSGDVRKSPEWVKKIGLRWFWRLIREPKRLGPKYWMTLQVFSSMLWKQYR